MFELAQSDRIYREFIYMLPASAHYHEVLCLRLELEDRSAGLENYARFWVQLGCSLDQGACLK